MPASCAATLPTARGATSARRRRTLSPADRKSHEQREYRKRSARAGMPRFAAAPMRRRPDRLPAGSTEARRHATSRSRTGGAASRKIPQPDRGPPHPPAPRPPDRGIAAPLQPAPPPPDRRAPRRSIPCSPVSGHTGRRRTIRRRPAISSPSLTAPRRDRYLPSFVRICASMSSVMRERSHSGFQPHSSRAQVSSSESGQLSAISFFTGSTS